MVTDRKAIAGYFTDEDKAKLEKEANKRRLTMSKTVEALVKKTLDSEDDRKKVELAAKFNKSKFEEIEGVLFKESVARTKLHSDMKELKDWLRELAQQLEHLYSQNTSQTNEVLTDEQIAAITGQSEWVTRMWRYGQRKPRGTRILEKLAPYEVKEGRWVRRG